jgi:RimJ/RimL family protein N-acetyltransferase
MRALAERPELRPLAGLRLRTPRLELRLGRDEEVRELAALAESGIHPPGQMLFAVAWTDDAGTPGFPDRFADFHEQALRDWSPEDWTLNLLVREHGRLVGTQGIGAERFGSHRVVATGSWLARADQGRGIGTEMRAAVLELAFTGLRAVAATSGWVEGNDASRRVSEKLGYTVTGRTEHTPRPGETSEGWETRRTHEGWVSPVTVTIEGLDPCLPLLGVPPSPSRHERGTQA